MTTDTNIKPFININGTSKDELRYQYMNVYQKLGEVLDMMAQSMPHGRDYKNNDEADEARTAQRENMKTIEDMRARYEATIFHIIDA